MHRFYISPNEWNVEALRLRGAEAHHAHEVLRLERGDKAVLFNGQGHEITAEIVSVGRDQIGLRKLHETRSPQLPCRITLAQAIPKGKNMDLIVQKAVEIGASEIAPLISERTIVSLDAKEARQKQARWEQVAVEAAKQCGQNWLPRIRTPAKLKDFFAEDASAATGLRPVDGDKMTATARSAVATEELRLIGSLQADAQHLKRILTEYQDLYGARPASVLMLIGPEGDFTPAELALAKSHGCRPLTLGPIILRVETAAIYCLSVLSYELL
jgi:16S rRNA (uracil1498-N3)-methyltransferase